MSASALMFFNCCQRACGTCTPKSTPIMIRWKHWYFHEIIGVPAMRRSRPDIHNCTPKSSKGSCGRTTPCRQMATQSWWRPHGTQPRARRAASSPQLPMGAVTVWPTPPSPFSNSEHTKATISQLSLFDGRGPRYSTATRLQLVGLLPLDAPPAAICLCTVL